MSTAPRSSHAVRHGHSSTMLGLLVAGAAACGLLASAAPAATTVTPPPGTPELAVMALRTTDLGPSARVARQRYVKPSEGVVAAYVREFRTGTASVRGKRLLYIESDIDLARTVADARLFFEFLPLGFALLDPDEIRASFREGGFRVTYVRIGKLVRLRAGDASLASTVRVGTGVGEIRTLLVFTRLNRVVATTFAMGWPRAKLGAADSATLARAVSAHIAEGLRPVSAAPPVVSGVPEVGQTLSATRGTWKSTPTRYAYQWNRCDAAGAACTAVAGATAETYTPTAADVGSTMRVAVTAANAHGSSTALSAPVGPVRSAPGAPANVTPPTISGSATVGQALTADPGSWSGSAPTFAYAWRRCDASGGSCTDIAGATGQTYTLVSADAGFTIRVTVTATNSSGVGTAVSEPTAVVT